MLYENIKVGGIYNVKTIDGVRRVVVTSKDINSEYDIVMYRYDDDIKSVLGDDIKRGMTAVVPTPTSLVISSVPST